MGGIWDDIKDNFGITDAAELNNETLEEQIAAAAQANVDGANIGTVDQYFDSDPIEEMSPEDVVGTSDEPRTDSPW